MRIIMDTNLWSYLGDEGAAEQFQSLVNSRGLTVVVPPSTLNEVLLLPSAQPRRRIIDVLTYARRVRLTSEAQLESMELVVESQRCRPAWVKSMVDSAKVASLNTYWTKRVWRDAKETPEAIHNFLIQQRSKENLILESQKRIRKQILQDHFDITDLSNLQLAARDAPAGYLRGWSGDPVDAWRVQTRDYYWHQLRIARRACLTKEDATVGDWVGAYLDLQRVVGDPADFTLFWIEDVQVKSLRRNWVRWAVETAQTALKISRGNPRDGQHSTHLFDCDVFLSADQRYVKTLQLVASHAPFLLAEPRFVSPSQGRSTVERIEAVLLGDV